MENKIQYGQRIQTLCLLILTALALSAALYQFSSILIPFVLAVFLFFCLLPVIDVQMRLFRIPRILAIITTALIGCVILFLLSLLVMHSINEIQDNSEIYQQQIQQISHQALTSIPLDKFGTDPNQIMDSLGEKTGETAKKALLGTMAGIKSVFTNGTLVLIFLIFLIAGKKKKAVGPPQGLRYEIETRIKRYVLTMIFTSATTGLLVGVTLWLLGAPFSYMFGFFAFMLNFIPSIGSIIATLLPMPVVLLSPELSPFAKVLAIIIPSIIQFTIGNIIQPKIMGQSLDLHPITILIALVFFGLIWGIVGMFLATPITAVLKVMFEKFEYTKSVALVMAGDIENLKQPKKPPD
ncbi:MAG: AI-2E family transporter [Planctomycetes bacterium]|nr:AI-2E family transporter [Planctomycetota bacterium]